MDLMALSLLRQELHSAKKDGLLAELIRLPRLVNGSFLLEIIII
jgi:hypothetical protein